MITTHGGAAIASCCERIRDATTPERLRTETPERSIPPIVIAIITPKARSAYSGRLRIIFCRFATRRNCPGIAITAAAVTTRRTISNVRLFDCLAVKTDTSDLNVPARR
jgi:hypothetical protein